MEHFIRNEFKFRAWSRQQAERFISHIPDLLVLNCSFQKWSDSSSDVIVTLEVMASHEQLNTILSGMQQVDVIKKTLNHSEDFEAFSNY